MLILCVYHGAGVKRGSILSIRGLVNSEAVPLVLCFIHALTLLQGDRNDTWPVEKFLPTVLFQNRLSKKTERVEMSKARLTWKTAIVTELMLCVCF